MGAGRETLTFVRRQFARMARVGASAGRKSAAAPAALSRPDRTFAGLLIVRPSNWRSIGAQQQARNATTRHLGATFSGSPPWAAAGPIRHCRRASWAPRGRLPVARLFSRPAPAQGGRSIISSGRRRLIPLLERRRIHFGLGRPRQQQVPLAIAPLAPAGRLSGQLRLKSTRRADRRRRRRRAPSERTEFGTAGAHSRAWWARGEEIKYSAD